MNRVQDLGEFEQQFEDIFEGGLDKRFYHEVTTPGTPDQEFSFEHGLEFTPNGFIVSSLDKAAIVYRGSTAWDASNIYLKCNTATVAIRVMVF